MMKFINPLKIFSCIMWLQIFWIQPRSCLSVIVLARTIKVRTEILSIQIHRWHGLLIMHHSFRIIYLLVGLYTMVLLWMQEDKFQMGAVYLYMYIGSEIHPKIVGYTWQVHLLTKTSHCLLIYSFFPFSILLKWSSENETKGLIPDSHLQNETSQWSCVKHSC